MADDAPRIEVTMPELRDVAAFAAVCAAPALEVFESVLPDDARPRAAIGAAQAFADGADRTKALRDAAWAAQRAAHEARDAGHPAAAEAARAAMAAAGAAFLHPLARATQVKHILGSAAHAARAFELAAGDDRTIGYAHVVRARLSASARVADVLLRYPAAPDGGGRTGELIRQLDVLLRRPEPPSRPRLPDADTVTWALQGLVGVPAWGAGVGAGGALTVDLGGRAISPAGDVRGEFVLAVAGGAWMIRRGDDVLATSDAWQEGEPVAASLAGLAVTGIALSVDGRALRTELDGSVTLIVVPEPERELAAERWRLVLPEGSIVAGPGPLLRLVEERAAEPRTPDARE